MIIKINQEAVSWLENKIMTTWFWTLVEGERCSSQPKTPTSATKLTKTST